MRLARVSKMNSECQAQPNIPICFIHHQVPEITSTVESASEQAIRRHRLGNLQTETLRRFQVVQKSSRCCNHDMRLLPKGDGLLHVVHASNNESASQRDL